MRYIVQNISASGSPYIPGLWYDSKVLHVLFHTCLLIGGSIEYVQDVKYCKIGFKCICWFINHCLVYFRCWKRKEWPSYSLRTKRTVRHAINEDHIVVVKHKNVVVLCPDGDEISGKERIKQQCLIVLYKVNTSSKDKENINMLESTSSVWNRKCSVNYCYFSIREELKRNMTASIDGG